MTRLKLLAPLAALLAALALAACGTETLDTAKLEREVESLAEDEGLDVDRVTCPEDIEAKEGDRFECEVETEDGVEIEADIEQRNTDGDVRVRISAQEVAKAKGGGDAAGGQDQSGQGGGAADGAQLQAIDQTIRSFVSAAREGDARVFCGQQSDARLERRYGGIEACVGSEEATTPAPQIATGEEVIIDLQRLEGSRATVAVSRPGGDGASTYEMVDEGGQGGWAVDSIDGQ